MPHHHRDHDLRRAQPTSSPLESRSAHADYRERSAIDRDGLTEDTAVRAEAVHPKVVAQDGERMPAGRSIVLWRERAAERGRDTQQIEVISGNQLPADALHLTAIADAKRGVMISQHAAKNLIASTQIPIHWIGERVIAHGGAVEFSLPVQEHQPIRIFHRQCPQQHLIQQAEDGGIRADPEGQREHRGGRESRASAELADGVAQILPDSF